MVLEAKIMGKFEGLKIASTLQISHLIFVDDVIFGPGNIEEWKYLLEILRVFCNASGMEINVEKSSLFHINLSDSAQEEMRNLLKFKMERMEDGFKYLRFF